MELAIPKTKRYTVAEYLRLADESPTKLEYKSGELIDMAGATFNHNSIAMNLGGELRNRLSGGPCRVVGSDQRVRTADDHYCYPDVTVVCGEPKFVSMDVPQMTLTNPTVLIEVLSPSTEATDRSEKLVRYINLPSLNAYLLVAQDKPRIESFIRKADGSWAVGTFAEGIDAVLRIESLKVEIPLESIYANVRFAAIVS